MDKDETGCQPPDGPVFCANNCGFFGSAATMNLCSQCYRDLVLKQTRAAKAVAASQNEQALENRSERQLRAQVDEEPASGSSGKALARGDCASADVSEEPIRQPPNRCFSCRKRLGLTGFKCRCGNVFCSLHRYSDKHSCPYDYRTAAREAIAKANPVIKADKYEFSALLSCKSKIPSLSSASASFESEISVIYDEGSLIRSYSLLSESFTWGRGRTL